MKLKNRLFFLTIIIIINSCIHDSKKKNIFPKNKCIYIEYTEITNCEVLEFYYKPITKVDSICDEIPVPSEEIIKFYPFEKILYINEEFSPNELTVLMINKEEISSFPYNYLSISIDSLKNDSILCFKLNNENHFLTSNSSIADTIVSIKKEHNKKLKYTTIINITNWGFILKNNIYDKNNFKEIKDNFKKNQNNKTDSMPSFIGGEEQLTKKLF